MDDAVRRYLDGPEGEWNFDDLADAGEVWDQAAYAEASRIADRILAVNSSFTAPETPAEHPLFGARDFRQGAAAPSATNWPPVPPPVRRSIPPASHSEDWLDMNRTNTGAPRQQLPYDPLSGLFTPSARSDASSESASDESGFAALLELHSEPEDQDDDAMPHSTRHPRRTSVVDLTQESSPEVRTREPPGQKRSAAAPAAQGPAPKRSRMMATDIEEVDLSAEAPSAEEELLQAQQREAIRIQQEADRDGPQRIGKRQCIICMENYTNCTATACGHFYCHECLTQALKAGEKNSERGTGNCPVCRKPLSRSGKKRHDIIPISFMKRDTYIRDYQNRAGHS